MLQLKMVLKKNVSYEVGINTTIDVKIYIHSSQIKDEPSS